MHYQIGDCIVKSENAALPTNQTNKIVLSYLENLPNGIIALDYGCGKCRYTKYLNKKTEKIVLLDSVIQISRIQRICDENLSVVEYAERYLSNSYVYPIESYNFGEEKFDFILCTNVLSAIPILNERYNILNNIYKMLKPSGYALISIQYSNTYFKNYKNKNGARKFGDGWLIKKGNNYSFYGIILPDKLIEMCQSVGLQIHNIYKHDGSIYLTVNIGDK